MTLLKRLQEKTRSNCVLHESEKTKSKTEIRIDPEYLDTLITNTVTAVLDEVEREVEAGDLTRKFMESLEHPTPEEYYAYNQGIADIKAIIKSKRTEI